MRDEKQNWFKRFFPCFHCSLCLLQTSVFLIIKLGFFIFCLCFISHMFSSTVEITAAQTYPLYAKSNISHYQQQPLLFFCSYFTGPIEEYKTISFAMDLLHATVCTWLLSACFICQYNSKLCPKCF